ncbi:P-loop containing nucleoside triphosphate hydrolase protein [Scenedesmus sp. NREL 46B-D3]|nr:P-loop containing nucleoside triphosphate hydrolase protein [Scenedesmus sp. NREL 46B-D3]
MGQALSAAQGSEHAAVPALPARGKPGPRKDGMAILGEVLSAAIATGFLVWGLKITLSYMDPYREQRREAKRQAQFLRQRLGRNIELNEFEMLLASQVLNPRSIDVSLDDIGGLEQVKEDMRLKVLRPLSEPDTFCTTLWRPVKGVLFYGPPGTGKTMLAKALAAESRCFFINVTASAIMSKWYGDANRFIRAIFTLAAKLQPAVIFIDEVDAFLTKRGAQSEHEATLQAKTEFMQLWDGMEGARGARVLVMGATNRPWMVDEAVLRRFALQYEIGLPGQSERAAILRRYLLRHQADMAALRQAGAQLADDEAGVDMDLLLNRPAAGAAAGAAGALDVVAGATQGYSGSDLMELASQAAQNVLVEYWSSSSNSSSSSSRLRQLTAADLLRAAADVQPSVSKAQQYNQGMHGSASFDASSSSGGAGLAGMAQLMAALAAAGSRSSSSRHSTGAGNNGSRKSRAAAAAGDAEEADDVEVGADSEEARRDEMYRMIGKMVMGSMSGVVLPQ